MAVAGDRSSIASLLSGLAEAPDFHGAASFLLDELVERTGSSRACLLRLDDENENLNLVACDGFEPDDPSFSIPVHDLGNPLVVSTDRKSVV